MYRIKGYLQKQSAPIGTAIVGTEGSAALYLMGMDIQVHGNVCFDTIASISYLAESDVYINGNRDFPNHRARNNNSDYEYYVQGERCEFR